MKPALFTYQKWPYPGDQVYAKFTKDCVEADRLKKLVDAFCYCYSQRLHAGRKGDFGSRITHELNAARLAAAIEAFMAEYGYTAAEIAELLQHIRRSQDEPIKSMEEHSDLQAAADFSARDTHPEWFSDEMPPPVEEALDILFNKLRDCLAIYQWVIENDEYRRVRQRKLSDARLAAFTLEECLERREYDPAKTAWIMWQAWALGR